MADEPLDGYTKDAVRQHCETALQRADVAGIFPTPIDRVLEVSGVNEILDIGDLPAVSTPKVLKQLLGAILFDSRTVYVDKSQRGSRVEWTKGHEAAHKILPWHEPAAYLDDDRRLFKESAESLEDEANFGAEYLLFQGPRTMNMALDYQHGIAVPILLASEATGGPSIAAYIRYYVENHPSPMALVMTGRRRSAAGTVPVYLRRSSATWNAQFPNPRKFIGPTLDITTGAFGLNGAVTKGSVTTGEVVVTDVNGKPQPSIVEAFDNGYVKFFLLRPRPLVRLGRRISTVIG